MTFKTIAIFITTKNGQTRTIAHYIKDKIIKESNEAIQLDVHEIDKYNSDLAVPSEADLVILGAPVYAQKFPTHFMKWVHGHRNELQGRKTAFFSVSLNAADKRPESRNADQLLIQKFIDNTGLVPDFVASLGGALKYQSYNWFIRLLMKRISAAVGGPTDTSRNYDLTDWTDVDSFVTAILRGELKSTNSANLKLTPPTQQERSLQS